MMKPSRACCEAMSPRLGPGCVVLIDRHYNSLSPYRRNDQTMYAVANGDEAVIRYVSVTTILSSCVPPWPALPSRCCAYR